MDDRLDSLLSAAMPLLTRIGEVLTVGGAPAEHSVWAELRRVRLMPADAARAVAALSPEALAVAVPDLRADARACAKAATTLPPPDSWTGDAADAYEDLRRRATTHLSGGNESLDERLEATADLAEALADWMTRTRSSLATALTEAMSTDETLTLMTMRPAAQPTTAEVFAAADLATYLLRTIADNYDEATDLLYGSAQLTMPLPM
jgi:uncharacterized protein YukE